MILKLQGSCCILTAKQFEDFPFSTWRKYHQFHLSWSATILNDFHWMEVFPCFFYHATLTLLLAINSYFKSYDDFIKTLFHFIKL